LARRFVAGETASDAIEAARRMNARGIRVILDFLGEDVNSAAAAAAAADEYLRLLERIARSGVDASVSLKLSQMGLLLSADLCLQNLEPVLKEAARRGNFVWLDMEGSALTERTLDLFGRLRERYNGLGVCLQSYLVRTGGDLDRLMRRPLTVRLCKGAYQEPPSIAFRSRQAVDGNYRLLIQKAFDHLEQGVFPAFATHDRSLIDHVIQSAREKRIGAKEFEFQMLYGIANRLLERLAREGFQTRVYIPYGTAWLPYFIRRLRERKENVYFLMRSLWRS